MKKISILALLIGLTVLYGYYHKKKLENYLAKSTDSLIRELPDVSLPIFNSAQKINFKQTAKRTKYTVVHFWATWCGPCEKEFPDLMRLVEKMKGKDIQFLLIAVDDDKLKIKKFLKKFEKISTNYILLEDKSGVHRKFFGISKLPESYIFDQKARLKRSLIGPQEWLSAPLIRYFDNLLN